MGTVPTATVRLKKNGEEIRQAAIGVGTVDAIYKAIEAIAQVEHQFLDFSVESITEQTEAMGKVTVKIASSDGRTFTGRGASLDVMEAAARAYVQALNKLVYHTAPSQTPQVQDET
jgi:2-isopropylmalate synthase